MNFNKYGNEESYVSRNGVIFLFSGKGARDQCNHNDFQVEADSSPEDFMIATGSEGCRLHLCHGSHICIRYHKSRKENLSELLEMEVGKIAPF